MDGKFCKEIYDEESGTVMLEMTYCMAVVIFVLIFFLSFGFFLYQKTIVSIIANEVAEEVSQTYKLTDADSESITADDIEGVGLYRYWFKKSKFDSAAETKAESLASVRLSQTSLAKKSGSLSVEVETVTDDIGRRHCEVTVSQNYLTLLSGMLKIFGYNRVNLIESTAYVETFDALGYVNTVQTYKYLYKEISDELDVVDIADSVIGAINSIADLFTD